MKKVVCAVLVFGVLISCLASCAFTEKIVAEIEEKSQATPKVTEMMEALAENRTSDASALLHPDAPESSDNAITQMSIYLAGRETESIELKNLDMNSSGGIKDRKREEQGTYQVTLNDGTVLSVNMVYVSDSTGSGFTSFQLVLGVG